jgi:hypothetical protein
VNPSVLAVAERARELAASLEEPTLEWSRELSALAGMDPALARAAAHLCNEWFLAGDTPSGNAAALLDKVQVGLTDRDQRLGLR